MAITASMVKELREMTGAGMMDCKKALTETDGDIEAAVDVLKKSGAAKAEKKASRIAAEGITKVASEGSTAVVVEVNSETDFVAKNEKFQNFVQEVADKALASSVEKAGDGEDVVDILGMKAELDDMILQIGEKLSIRRFAKVSGEVVASYIHAGGKIGVLVAAKGAADDGAREALTNIAMQIAAMNPQYISRADISAEQLAKIKDITIDSSINDAPSLPKPILNTILEKAKAGIWSKEDVDTFEEHKSNMNFVWNFMSDEAKAKLSEIAMNIKSEIMEQKMFMGAVEGRVSKQLKEICLLDQTYVKADDGKQSVANYLKSVNPSLEITSMVRFEVGEGMQKKEENFAEEVAKQMNQ